MKISYCTTCQGRLWQLKKTINHNLRYTSVGEVELLILFYNDYHASIELAAEFQAAIADGRLRIINRTENVTFKDGSTWSYGYTKDIVHMAAYGDVLFNLDADNFIDDTLHHTLLNLQPNEVVITKQSEWSTDGRSGRIGLHKSLYGVVRYGDDGRRDDIELMNQCVGQRVKFREVSCKYTPVPNDPEGAKT